MFGQKFFPYSTLQELNLDWILTKVKIILRFIPDDGAVGQILRRTRDGAEWSNEQGGGGGAVDSVNGQTGTVVLTASDVGALPDSYTAPVTSVNTKTGVVVLDKTDVGLGNVANVAQYSASNPPPYPVTSVNGQTGAVSVSVPTKTSDLNNDSGFVTSAQAAAAAPVQSVNGQTGAVSVCENNNFSTGVLLDSYTNSFYTCPQDGYVVASCAAQPTSKAICRLYGATSSDNYYVQLGGWSNSLYATWAVFARKGMRVKVITLENSGHVLFTPIV